MKTIALVLLFFMVRDEAYSFLDEPSVYVEGEGWNLDDINDALSKTIFEKAKKGNIAKRVYDLMRTNDVQDPKILIESCSNSIQNMVGPHRKSFESKNLERVFEKCIESLIADKSVDLLKNIQEGFDQIFGNNLDDQLSIIDSLFSLNRMKNPSKTLKSLKNTVDSYQIGKTNNIARVLQKLLESMSVNKLDNPSEVLEAFEKSIKEIFGKQVPLMSQSSLLNVVEDLVKLLRFKSPIQVIENLTSSIKKQIGDKQIPSEALTSVIQNSIDQMVQAKSPSLTELILKSVSSQLIKSEIGASFKLTTLKVTQKLKDYPKNILRDYPISSFSNDGFSMVYKQLNTHPTSHLELNVIKSLCNENSVVCVGGGVGGSDKLLLVSCGNCISILTERPKENPIELDSVYWHLVEDYGFGFSKGRELSRIFSSGEQQKNSLFWYTNGYGGFNIGDRANLQQSSIYTKYIFLRK